MRKIALVAYSGEDAQLMDMLEKESYSIITWPTEKSMTDLIANEQPDLILYDLKGTNLDSFPLDRPKAEGIKDVPIILFVDSLQHASLQLKDDVFQGSPCCYIVSDIEELLDTTEKALALGDIRLCLNGILDKSKSLEEMVKSYSQIMGIERDLHPVAYALDAYPYIDHALYSKVREFNEVVRTWSKDIRAALTPILQPLGVTDEQPTRVNLNEALLEALSAFDKLLSNQKIEVDRGLSPNLPEMFIGHGQLKQVMLNLILNAAEAMPQGGTLSATTKSAILRESDLLNMHRFTHRRRDDPPSKRFLHLDSPLVREIGHEVAVVEIRDTGHGISEQDFLRIFDSSFSTKPDREGVGLAIADKIVRGFGGVIDVDSHDGGTCFTIYLPIRMDPNLEYLMGSCEGMQEVYRTIYSIADADATVMIQGQSGTGKELVAQTLHALSRRRRAVYVKVDCGTLAKNLIENELFGHEKGAYTSADSAGIGKIEMADGGTVFLDEIGNLSQNAQTKLLRVLEYKEFERIGSPETKSVDVRFIVATRDDLAEEVEKGNFRDDLYYRLNVVPIRIPTLKERWEDIPHFVNRFLRESKERSGRSVEGVAPQALDALCKYDWPGNVRELRHLIERLVLLVNRPLITLDDLPPEIVRASELDGSALDVSSEDGGKLPAIERNLIEKTLQQTGGNQTQAAKQLGISRKTLRTKMKNYGLLN